MVVDYNRFERGQTILQDGLLWVLEQLPYVHYILQQIYNSHIGHSAHYTHSTLKYMCLVYTQACLEVDRKERQPRQTVHVLWIVLHKAIIHDK